MGNELKKPYRTKEHNSPTNWFWPSTTGGRISISVLLIIAFVASTIQDNNILDGLINMAIWYSVMTVLRALYIHDFAPTSHTASPISPHQTPRNISSPNIESEWVKWSKLVESGDDQDWTLLRSAFDAGFHSACKSTK